MSAPIENYAFIHQEIMPLSKAFLHVSDLAIQRGYGIFDFCRVSQSHPLFLDNYLQRFYNSADLMQLVVPMPVADLKATIYALLQKNNMPESSIKIILTGGYSPDGYTLGKPNLIITQQALSLPDQALLAKGIKIITYEYEREIPPAKTINYTMGIRLQKKIQEQNAADVLYHQNGIVTEFPRSNFFIVKKDDTIITSAHNVLPGITRQNVLSLTGKKYNIQEGTVTLQDVAEAKEAFMTSTTKRILPIVQVNDSFIGNGKPGDCTLALLQDLLALEKEEISSAAKVL